MLDSILAPATSNVLSKFVAPVILVEPSTCNWSVVVSFKPMIVLPIILFNSVNIASVGYFIPYEPGFSL